MKICVIGTGYVGLVGSAVFADWGNQVIGVDNNPEKIKMIESGTMPIFEPGLKELVSKNISNGNLKWDC
jgi:UDPglucose 6-dehydrogenase